MSTKRPRARAARAATVSTPPVALDIRTVTLGEMAAVELASGVPFDQLFRTKATRMLAALYITEVCRRDLSSSGPVPSWSELSARRLLEL